MNLLPIFIISALYAVLIVAISCSDAELLESGPQSRTAVRSSFDSTASSMAATDGESVSTTHGEPSEIGDLSE